MDVVLHSRRHNDVSLLAPRFFAREELYAEFISIVFNAVVAACTHFEQVVNLFFRCNAFGIIDVAIRTGEGNNFSAEFSSFLADTPGYVTEACGSDGLAFDILAVVLEDIFEEVNSAVARSFRTDEGTAVAEAFTCEDAIFEAAFQAAIFTIKVTDFTAANAHVTSGNVDIGTNVTIESLHEALAETHDFSIGFASRIEVGTAFSAADRKTRQGILEDLFETEEFDDAGVNVLLETKAAFVGPDSAVELETVTGVRMIFAFIVLPYNAEGELAFRFNDTVEEVEFFIFRMTFYDGIQGRENFFDGLDEFRFVSVFRFDIFDYRCKILVHNLITP